MTKYRDIAAAWVNKTKAGETYLSVKLSKDLKAGDSINLFINKFKEDGDKKPNYRATEPYEVESEEVDPEDIPF